MTYSINWPITVRSAVPEIISSHWRVNLKYVASGCYKSHSCAVVKECRTDDDASQWGNGKVDPSPRPKRSVNGNTELQSLTQTDNKLRPCVLVRTQFRAITANQSRTAFVFITPMGGSDRLRHSFFYVWSMFDHVTFSVQQLHSLSCLIE